MKNIIVSIVALIIIAGGAYYFIKSTSGGDTTYVKPPNDTEEVSTPTETPTSTTTPNTQTENGVTTTEVAPREPVTTIGTSVEGRPIMAYHFGTGERELLLIGGIHGGYSWNTALLSYELIDWLKKETSVIPEDVTVTIIPTLNPDGLQAIVGTDGVFTAAAVKGSETDRIAARFNANDVDLNRNFDCEWKSSGTWQNRTVSGGARAFSEPETKALAEYVATHEPAMVVAWYSAAGGVYASKCADDIMTATLTLTNRFATAAGYTAHEEFDYYEITGDMVNWFAKQEIPAISVLLTSHEKTELAKNKAGVQAVLKMLSETNND